jgi:hypothetical protein
MMLYLRPMCGQCNRIAAAHGRNWDVLEMHAMF